MAEYRTRPGPASVSQSACPAAGARYRTLIANRIQQDRHLGAVPDVTIVICMAAAPDETRIDKWLWAARFFKTRSQATTAVTGGKVEINGDTAKPSKTVKVGDRIKLRLGPTEYRLTITGIGERRGSASVAQTLYEESPESWAERQRIAAE